MAQWTIIPAPTIALIDDLVKYIRREWEPGAPSGVERAHKDQTIVLDKIEGRHVRLVALGYDSFVAARGVDFYRHRIGVLTFERYKDDADADETIPIEWIDERVDFVHTLRDALDFMRDGVQPDFNPDLLTLTAPVEEIYSSDMLAAKVFWSWWEIEIQEQQPI